MQEQIKQTDVSTQCGEPAVKVSVLISAYNVERYIEEALDSVRRQTLKDIEIICVNDGSSDSTLEKIKSYMLKEPRIRLISQKNAGQSAARNAAAHVAQGKWLYYMDADDIIEPDAMESLYSYGEERDLQMVFTNSMAFADSPEWEETAASDYENCYKIRHTYPDVYTGQEFLVKIWKNEEFVAPAWTYLVRRDFLQTNDLRFRVGIQREDDLMQLSCLLYAERVGRVNRELIRHRIRSNSIITQKLKLQYVYSDILVIRELTALLYRHPVEEAAYQVLREFLEFMCTKAARDYERLDEEERAKQKGLTQDLRMEIDLYAIRTLEDLKREEEMWHLLRERDSLRAEYDHINASMSYRVGKVFTAPLRKLRDLVKH